MHLTTHMQSWLVLPLERGVVRAGRRDREPDARAHRTSCDRRQELLPQPDALREPVQVPAA